MKHYQATLLAFDHIGAHVPPPAQPVDTSLAAAERIAPAQGTLQRRVLDYIAGQGERGATDEEVQNALGMNPSTQRPRRVELADAGYIVDSGATRPTASGRQAVVWMATTRGAN